MAGFLYGVLQYTQGVKIAQTDETAVLPRRGGGGEIGAVMGAPAFLPLQGRAGDQNGAQEQVTQFTTGDGIGKGCPPLPHKAGTLCFQSAQERECTIKAGGVTRQPDM